MTEDFEATVLPDIGSEALLRTWLGEFDMLVFLVTHKDEFARASDLASACGPPQIREKYILLLLEDQSTNTRRSWLTPTHLEVEFEGWSQGHSRTTPFVQIMSKWYGNRHAYNAAEVTEQIAGARDNLRMTRKFFENP